MSRRSSSSGIGFDFGRGATDSDLSFPPAAPGAGASEQADSFAEWLDWESVDDLRDAADRIAKQSKPKLITHTQSETEAAKYES